MYEISVGLLDETSSSVEVIACTSLEGSSLGDVQCYYFAKINLRCVGKLVCFGISHVIGKDETAHQFSVDNDVLSLSYHLRK